MFSPRYSTILAFLTTLYSVQLSHRCVVAEIDKCTKYSGESCKNCVDLDGCAYCEKTKACMDFDLVKDTLNKACEGQEWKIKHCVDEKEDAKLRKQRKELSERHKEREKERREKRDEIRKKYGLTTA